MSHCRFSVAALLADPPPTPSHTRSLSCCTPQPWPKEAPSTRQHRRRTGRRAGVAHVAHQLLRRRDTTRRIYKGKEPSAGTRRPRCRGTGTQDRLRRSRPVTKLRRGFGRSSTVGRAPGDALLPSWTVRKRSICCAPRCPLPPAGRVLHRSPTFAGEVLPFKDVAGLPHAAVPAVSGVTCRQLLPFSVWVRPMDRFKPPAATSTAFSGRLVNRHGQCHSGDGSAVRCPWTTMRSADGASRSHCWSTEGSP